MTATTDKAGRLVTGSTSHQIYVIEDGQVAESGIHEELLRMGGRYASFYRLQLMEQDRPKPAVISKSA